MQIKITTIIGGESHESTIAVPGKPQESSGSPQTDAQMEAHRVNSAILHAVGGAISMSQQQKIERITAEVIG